MAKKAKRSCTIGIDLGGTKILSAVVDDKGKVVAAIKALTQAQEGAEAVITRIKQTMDQAVAKAKLAKKDIVGIGIGVPGVIDAKRGVIVKITNIPGMERVPIAKILREWLGHAAPVVLSNDVRVATWGEYLHGAGKGYKHLVTVWVGTGIGGGIILLFVYFAILIFIGNMFVIAVASATQTDVLANGVLILFLIGVALLFIAVLIITIEVHFSHRASHIEAHQMRV